MIKITFLSAEGSAKFSKFKLIKIDHKNINTLISTIKK